VAHVLSVAALEIGDPLTFDVLVKTDDPPPHLLSHLRWSCECVRSGHGALISRRYRGCCLCRRPNPAADGLTCLPSLRARPAAQGSKPVRTSEAGRAPLATRQGRRLRKPDRC
jgi:hypothetical protein